MEAIGPGSVVECIKATTDRLVVGRLYRVVDVTRAGDRCPKCGDDHPNDGLWIDRAFDECERSFHGSYHLDRFRPIGGDAKSVEDLIRQPTRVPT